jgi:flavin-dependent dehydrogenase
MPASSPAFARDRNALRYPEVAMSLADVFIVGGGPAGLAAAIAARRRGLDVALADAGRPPIDKACGEGLLPDGVAAARALGVDLEGVPLHGIRFLDGGRSAEARFPRGHGLAIRRTHLHAALAARAHDLGVRLRWGAPMQDFDRLRACWIVGADGSQSQVRRWAGLAAARRQIVRYGFRRHYSAAPWSDLVEIHWADRFQLYITPVGVNELDVALLGSDPRFRLDDALALFPRLARRLGPSQTDLQGALTVTRRLRSVCRGRVALIGDASGSVDAITGDGISLAFRQAEALAAALEAGNLTLYAAAHQRLFRRPRLMGDLLLLLDRHPAIRRAAVHLFAAHPPLFARMLAAHVQCPR